MICKVTDLGWTSKSIDFRLENVPVLPPLRWTFVSEAANGQQAQNLLLQVPPRRPDFRPESVRAQCSLARHGDAFLTGVVTKHQMIKKLRIFENLHVFLMILQGH